MSANVQRVRVDLPARAGKPKEFPAWLDQRLVTMLAKRGVTTAWSHQVEAWESIRAGHHLVLATPTASGKSLAWSVPVFQALAADRNARALLVVPTKALAADQVQSLRQLGTSVGIDVRIADGDHDIAPVLQGPPERWPQVIATNPIMLSYHLGGTKPGSNWTSWLRGLRYLVIDELHLVTGVSGVHVAWTLRRALRATHRPVQVIGASATLADPQSHLFAVTGVDGTVDVIRESGAPAPARHVIAVSGGDPVCAELAARLVHQGHQVVAYAASRMRVEEVAAKITSELGHPVAVHHAGVGQRERTAIEEGLRTGSVPIVVATTTLVAGVDVPADAVVAFDLPTSQASIQQLAGRAGRRGKDAIVLLSSSSNEAIGTAMRRPEQLMDLVAGPIRVACEPFVEPVMRAHLLRAAWERPLSTSEYEAAALPVRVTLDHLVRDGELTWGRTGLRRPPSAPVPPVPEAERYIRNHECKVVADGKTLTSLGRAEAVSQFQPGAVVPWRGGKQLRVISNDHKVVRVEIVGRDVPSARVQSYQRIALSETNLATVASRRAHATVSDARLIIEATRLLAASGTYRALREPVRFATTTRALVITTHEAVDEGLAHALLIAAESLGVPASHVGHRVSPTGITLWDRPGNEGSVDLIAQRLDQTIEAAATILRSCTCQRDGCLACSLLLSCSKLSSKSLATTSLGLIALPRQGAGGVHTRAVGGAAGL